MRNMELTSNSRFFSEVFRSGVSGAKCIWQRVYKAKLRKLKCSSSKQALALGEKNV
jgi:hypothetical protein